MKNKVTKDMVPEDFSLSLALVDAIPVLFFGVNCMLLGTKFSSAFFMIGAVLCLLGGAGKVLWKVIVVLRKKNIWFLFVQMRILMPIGFLMMVAALALNHSRLSWQAIVRGIMSFPSVIGFGIGVLSFILVSVFAVKLDNGDLRVNWLEQLTNSVGQIAICIGILML